jgi:hypothetical protein
MLDFDQVEEVDVDHDSENSNRESAEENDYPDEPNGSSDEDEYGC